MMPGTVTTDPVVPWLTGVHQHVEQLAEKALAHHHYPLWLAPSPSLVATCYGPAGLVVAPPPVAALMPLASPRMLLDRVKMERDVLDDHTPDRFGRCPSCDGAAARRGEVGGPEPWPCTLWRLVAGGWRHMPGYEAEFGL